jgi:transposase
MDAIWLAIGITNLRAGIDRLLARVVHSFPCGAQPYHAYVFANKRANLLKILVYDGAGMWLCTRRLQAGRFIWPHDAKEAITLTRE